MRVAITGATGVIGSALVRAFAERGDDIVVVTRRPPDAARRATSPGVDDVVRWDPARGEIDAARLAGIDAAVHLAGESIFGLWTAAKKERIRRSRIDGTRLLATTLAGLDARPSTLVSASGINYYGSRPEGEALDEAGAPGHGFLAALCRDWEAATKPAEAAGIRVVHTRSGLVLTPDGGALRVMLPLFRLGLGGRIGDADRTWSWIAIDDVVGAMMHALGAPRRSAAVQPPRDGTATRRRSRAASRAGEGDRAGRAAGATSAGGSLVGPVNLVSPNPVSHAEFVHTLARVLHRPAVFRVPAFLPRLLLDRDQADGTLLHGAHVVPRRLRETGYRFRFVALEPALRHLLGRDD